MTLTSQNLISFDQELLPNPKGASTSSPAHSKVKVGKLFIPRENRLWIIEPLSHRKGGTWSGQPDMTVLL
jgi:hypothetical protein